MELVELATKNYMDKSNENHNNGAKRCVRDQWSNQARIGMDKSNKGHKCLIS